jgi:hypothetical protein
VEIRSIRGVDTLRVHTKQISVQPNPWFKVLSFPLFRPFKVKPEVLCQPNRSRSSRILVERSLSPLDRARASLDPLLREERSLRLLVGQGIEEWS